MAAEGGDDSNERNDLASRLEKIEARLDSLEARLGALVPAQLPPAESPPDQPATGEDCLEEQEEQPSCPSCHSTDVTADQTGLGLRKVARGAVLFGTLGLAGLFLGGRKVYVTCLRCGHAWAAPRIDALRLGR